MTVTVQASWFQGASASAGATSAGTATVSGASLAFAGMDMVRVGLALAFCLALGVIVILVLRRSQAASGTWLKPAGTHRIALSDSVRLGSRATLHLVEYDDRVVLLASDASGVKLLDARDRRGREHDA